MPLSINVGLSRKASKDYQSTGVSINVTAELDQALLAKPQELQQQIDQLYQQAQGALDRQVQQSGPATAPARPATNGYRRNGTTSNGNGNGNGHARSGGLTESQKKAIYAIGQRLGLDPQMESEGLHGCSIEELSLRQASELIDHLKGLQQPTGGRVAGER